LGAYLLRRVAWAAAQLVLATMILFALFYIAPGPDLSVSNTFATPSHGEGRNTGRFQETGSAPAEYVRFLGHILHGEFGRSQRTHQDVGFLLARAWPATASVVFGGLVLWVLISVSVGVYSAMRPRSLIDRAGNVFVLFAVSAHPVWLGLVLSYLLGYRLHWFPFWGYCDMFHPSPGLECGGPVQWAYHLLLPWIVFAAGFAALYTRMIRSSLLETMQEDYVRTARAKGLSELRVLRRHTFRTAMVPIATMLTMDVGLAFGGTMFVERVFNIPGLGRMLVLAVPRRDLPVILGIMVVVSAFVLVLNLLLDVLYGILDPRISILPARRPRKSVVPRPAPASAEALPQSR
jgi:peptide/nickel transport system permease protein